jgi:hypothetical protein
MELQYLLEDSCTCIMLNFLYGPLSAQGQFPPPRPTYSITLHHV